MTELRILQQAAHLPTPRLSEQVEGLVLIVSRIDNDLDSAKVKIKESESRIEMLEQRLSELEKRIGLSDQRIGQLDKVFRGRESSPKRQ